MKQTLPAKEIEVCDICHREGYLEVCVTCGKQYCITHQATISGSYGFLHLCCKCGKRDDVKEIAEKYSDKLYDIYQERKAAFQALPK